MAVIFGSDKLIIDGDASKTIVSDSIPLERKCGFCVEAILVGTLSGVIQLEMSLTNGPTDSHWHVIPGSVRQLFNNIHVVLDLPVSAYSYVRLRYRALSGSGTLNANFNTKEIQ